MTLFILAYSPALSDAARGRLSRQRESTGWPTLRRKRTVLHDTKILMTGATGMVGRPIAMELARANEVWAVGQIGRAHV